MVIRRKRLLDHSAAQCLILGQLWPLAFIRFILAVNSEVSQNLLSWCVGQEYFYDSKEIVVFVCRMVQSNAQHPFIAQ